MRVLLLCLCAAIAVVAGCTKKQPNASDATLAAVAYRDPGPAKLTLYTMVNNRTGGGGHSSLMINASERVIFDPAGSFYADVIPERDDVLFGITPAAEQAYRGAHARSTFHVAVQEVEVTPEQAEIAYQLALQAGPVPGAFCSNATSRLLQQVPGFETLKPSLQPTKLRDQFGALPGVTTSQYFEDDSPDLQVALAEGNERLKNQ